MKEIVLYGRRNTCLLVLNFLVAKGYKVKVITDDMNVIWTAVELNCELVTLTDMGEYDLFICCHGWEILPKEILQHKRMLNIHPCLRWYKGHDPISRYIKNKNTVGSVEVQYLIEKVDAGELICAEIFRTPVCHTHQDFYNIALPYYPKVISRALNTLEV